MLIEATSEVYKKLFGNYPFGVEFFQSAAMPYETMVGCLSDPSICANSRPWQVPPPEYQSTRGKRAWKARPHRPP